MCERITMRTTSASVVIPASKRPILRFMGSSIVRSSARVGSPNHLVYFCGLKRLLDRLAQHPERLQACVILVVGLDEIPRRQVGAGARDHVANRLLVEAPLLAIAPIFGGDLEALERGVRALLESAELLLFADGEPELDDDDAVFGQSLFEIV